MSEKTSLVHKLVDEYRENGDKMHDRMGGECRVDREREDVSRENGEYFTAYNVEYSDSSKMRQVWKPLWARVPEVVVRV